MKTTRELLAEEMCHVYYSFPVKLYDESWLELADHLIEKYLPGLVMTDEH